MKKIRIVIVLFLLSPTTIVNAQHLKVTTDGLINPENNESYVVVECNNKSAEELYNIILNYVQESYNSPVDALKGQIENEYIRFRTFVDKSTFPFQEKAIKIDYHTTIRIKENKVKIEFESIDMKYGIKNLTINYVRQSDVSIYDPKLKIRSKATGRMLVDIENYFNSSIDAIKEYIENYKKPNDW